MIGVQPKWTLVKMHREVPCVYGEPYILMLCLPGITGKPLETLTLQGSRKPLKACLRGIPWSGLVRE